MTRPGVLPARVQHLHRGFFSPTCRSNDARGRDPMHTRTKRLPSSNTSQKLGLKVVMMASMVRRPIPALAKKAVTRVRRGWESGSTCWTRQRIQLRSGWENAPARHLADVSFGGRAPGFGVSPSNFVYNHIGHFAARRGGLPRRCPGRCDSALPSLKIAFLEGGVDGLRTLW